MLKEIKSREFANGKVYVLETEDGYPIETTDTFLPYYTKDCINEHINELKDYHLGSREDRWMIGVSVMSGCPVHCQFCLDSDTNILMSDLSYKKIKDIEKGDTVVSTVLAKKRDKNYREKTTKYLKSTKVLNTFKRKYSGKLYNIYLSNGDKLRVTENHPIAVFPRNSTHHRNYFYKASELVLSDKLLMVKGNDDISDKFGEIRCEDAWKFGWLNGFIEGDGTYNKVANKNCHYWNISQSDKELIDIFVEFCDYFGIERGNPYINHIKESSQKKYKDNYIVRIGESGIVKLNELYNRYKNNRVFKKGYVAGFWDAEGFSFFNNSVARFCNTNFELLEKVQKYLKELFYNSEIRLYDSGKARNNSKDTYILETSISRLSFNLIFRPLHSKRNYFEYEDKKYKGIEEISIAKIEIEDVVDYPVYNFETEEHTYIANNVVVHNCATGMMKKYRNLTSDEIVEQVKFILSKNPNVNPKDCKEFKINWTRMGEGFLNIDNVKEAITKINELLPNVRIHHYISTIGIKGSDFSWIKGNITLQISLHSLDEERRNELIPFKNKMTIEELGQIRTESDLKTTVNMTLVDEADFDIEKLKKYFDPEYFFIKVSPINPNPISEKNHMGKGVIKVENLV